MVVFGLILLLLGLGAGAFALWVATSGTQTAAPGGGTAMAIDLLGNTLELSIVTLILLGVIGVLLALLGLWVMIAATKRKARAAKERHDLRKSQKRQEKELAETRQRLGEDRDDGAHADTRGHDRPDTLTDDRRDVRADDRRDTHTETRSDTIPPRSGQSTTDPTAPRYEETYRVGEVPPVERRRDDEIR